jgi:hypothetical protein
VPASSKKIAESRILEAALSSLKKGLDRVGAPWMVIGGIAVIVRGVRRTTTDIDAAVRGDGASMAHVLAALAAHDIVGRIPDAEEFAQTTMVLLLRHTPTGVDLDVSFAWSEFEYEALSHCSMARFGKVSVPTALAEDLVIYKQIAARPKDVEDIQALMALYPNLSSSRIRQRVSELEAMLREGEPLSRTPAKPSPQATRTRSKPDAAKRKSSTAKRTPAAGRTPRRK